MSWKLILVISLLAVSPSVGSADPAAVAGDFVKAIAESTRALVNDSVAEYCSSGNLGEEKSTCGEVYTMWGMEFTELDRQHRYGSAKAKIGGECLGHYVTSGKWDW